MTAPALTRRELGILRGLAAGLKLSKVSAVIGATDHVSPDYVRRAAPGLYRKFGAETATGAVMAAIRAGVLPCPCPHHTTHPLHREGTNPS